MLLYETNIALENFMPLSAFRLSGIFCNFAPRSGYLPPTRLNGVWKRVMCSSTL